MAKQYETGHAKILESWTKLVTLDATLDPVRLNAPPDLASIALNAKEASAGQLQNKVGNSRADWRTIALARTVLVDKFDRWQREPSHSSKRAAQARKPSKTRAAIHGKFRAEAQNRSRRTTPKHPASTNRKKAFRPHSNRAPPRFPTFTS